MVTELTTPHAQVQHKLSTGYPNDLSRPAVVTSALGCTSLTTNNHFPPLHWRGPSSSHKGGEKGGEGEGGHHIPSVGKQAMNLKMAYIEPELT